jgi:hypothetical protein
MLTKEEAWRICGQYRQAAEAFVSMIESRSIIGVVFTA